MVYISRYWVYEYYSSCVRLTIIAVTASSSREKSLLTVTVRSNCVSDILEDEISMLKEVVGVKA